MSEGAKQEAKEKEREKELSPPESPFFDHFGVLFAEDDFVVVGRSVVNN